MTTLKNTSQPEYLSLIVGLMTADLHSIADHIFDMRLFLNPNNWRAQAVEFKNCKFLQPVKFEHLSLQSGVKFENCIFENILYFDDCNASNSDSRFERNGACSIDLINCTVKRGFNIHNCKLWFGVRATQNCVFDHIQFTKSAFGKVQFIDTIVKDLFENSEIESKSGYFFEKNRFEKALSFYECKTGILAEECTFDITFYAGCTFERLLLGDSIFNNDVSLFGCEINRLNLYGSVFERLVSLDSYYAEKDQSGTIHELNIGDSEFRGELLFTGLNSGAIDIPYLGITCTEKLKGNLNFSHCGITQFSIGGTNNTSIAFSYTRMQKLQFTRWVNNGLLSLISVGPEENNGSELVITKSLMGKTILSDVDLSDYEDIAIAHSNLCEITSNSVNWFADQQLSAEPGTSRPDTLKIKRDVYRQLKFAMEKQGDHFNRLRFRRSELAAYRAELRLRSFKERPTGDRAIMIFGWLNDYGFNWVRPSVLILTWVIISYSLLALLLTGQAINIGYLGNNAYNIFNLLNPAHKISELFDIGVKLQPSFWFYAWDFLERLILSLLLFQLVTAFRKYAN